MPNRRAKITLLLFAGFFLLLIGTLLVAIPVNAQTEPPDNKVTMYYFWGDGCPVCAKQALYNDALLKKYPEIDFRSYEVWYNDDNRQLFLDMAAVAGIQPSGVPTTFIGDKVWVGFTDSVKPEMEAAVVACIKDGCPDIKAGIPSKLVDSGGENIINVPLIGRIDLDAQSLVVSTALIGLVDGFNPCSLWVLSILLALVIYTGSRAKTLVVGLTFLIVAAATYGVFMVGLFSVFSYVAYLKWVQVVVALIALAFGLINVKDYFWYKKGVSLTISDKHKPTIFNQIRNVISSGKSIWAMIGATFVLAMGVTLVELPCTAGLPVLWSNLLAAQQVDRTTFSLLLGLYLLIYLIDELIVFFFVVVTLKATKLEEKHGRVLKLVGGIVMVTLAIIMVVKPELMNNIGSSLLIFGSAFGAAILVLILHRRILPKFGVRVGSEFSKTGSKRKSRRR